MSSRAEKERLKAQQEKFQAVLSGLLRDDDNKYCVDCDAKGPRWASWNLGIFMCIRCAGIHRNLGVHITKVKSVNLDQWNGDQIAMMMEMGNSRARAVYEANIPDNYRRPQTDSALETFIRAKYEHKKYIAREWVPPKPTLPKELLEDDREKKKPRPKPSGSIQLSSVASRSQTTSTAPQTTASKPTPKPVQATTAKPAEPQQPKAPPPSSNTADLIGLVFAQPVVNDTHAPEVPRNSSNSLLTDFMGQDITGDLNTSSQNNVNQVSNDSIEAKLFDDTTAMSPESGQKTTTKDSIMALYGGQQKQQQFGVPASDQYTCTPAGIDPAGYTYTNVVAPGIDPAGYTYTNVGTPGYDPTGYMYTNGVSGGVYMPQQQQNMGMYNMPQQSNMPMQQAAGYNNQTGMVGMHQGNPGMVQANMGVPQAQMGVPPGMMMGQGNVGVTQGGMAVPQGSMGVPQGNAGMYGQQMQFQQMQNQMASLRMGQPAQMNVVGGGMQNGLPAGQGWGAAPSGGQTLSNNLWQ